MAGHKTQVETGRGSRMAGHARESCWALGRAERGHYEGRNKGREKKSGGARNMRPKIYVFRLSGTDDGGANERLQMSRRSRDGLLRWRSSASEKARVKDRTKLREPRFCFQTRSEVDVLDDGYKWRKYGQKVVKNSLHPSMLGENQKIPTVKVSGKEGENQTLFIQNIPPRYHWSGLRQLFGRHGDVVSSFIARKNDRMEKRFGFVRFSNKEDTIRAMQRLNGFWLFRYCLSVKEARYRAKNLSGDQNSLSTSNLAARIHKDKSIGDEDSEANASRRRRVIQVIIDDDVVQKLQKCLVGTMATVCSSTQVEERLSAGSLGEVKTKFLGESDFLIEIVDDELYRIMEENKWSFLLEIFLKVHPWTESYRASERVTWIKLIGVPLHCWNHITFKRIAEQWGEVVAMGENALQELGCEEMTILIATSKRDLIDEVFDLEAGRDVFKIRIMEQSTNSSEKKNPEGWHEDDDSQLCCMGIISKGGSLSGLDGEERNIGEEVILGQRVNDVRSENLQKHIMRTCLYGKGVQGLRRGSKSSLGREEEDRKQGPFMITNLSEDSFMPKTKKHASLKNKVHREEESTELEGRSLSDSNLQERWQRQKMEAMKTLQIGRELELRRVIRIHRVEITLLQETKKENFMDTEISSFWCDDDFEFIFSNAIEGKYLTDDSICSVMNVYAPCEVSEQVTLWNAIVNVRRKNNNRWFMAGDFNAIRNHSERSGCSYRQKEITVFNTFIEDYKKDEANDLDERDREEVLNCTRRLWDLLKEKEDIWRQKSRLTWLKLEVLHLLLEGVVRKGFFDGIDNVVSNTSISHLQFADYTILFIRPDQSGLSNVKRILICFEMGSGLSINFRKSCLAWVKVDEDNLNQFALLVGCMVSSFPFKYLGIPLGADPRRTSMWELVIEKFKVKLVGWKNKMLSFVGRVVLINSVLSIFPLYYMSIFPVPKTVVSRIDKIRRGFLWGFDGNTRRLPRVNWGRLCLPKKKREAGIINLKAKNKALLAKWGWRFVIERGALWRSVICHKYGSGDLPWLVCHEDIKKASITWREIVNNLSSGGTTKWMSGDSFRWLVGDGKSALFWEDVWFGESALRSRYPRIYRLASRKYITVRDMVSAGVWHSLDTTALFERHLLDRELITVRYIKREMDKVSLNLSVADRIVWVHEVDGLFKVKKLTELLLSDGNFDGVGTFNFDKIWSLKVLPKVKYFLWMLKLNRVSTKAFLIKRGIKLPDAQRFCPWWWHIPGFNLQSVDEAFEFCYQFRWSGSIALAWFVSFAVALWRKSAGASALQSSLNVWLPPVSGQLKFIVDGSASSKSAGCGGVLRTTNRHIIAMFFGPVLEVNSDFAELVVIKIALEVFADSCWRGKAALVVESDSKVVLNWVQNASARPWRWGATFQQMDAYVLKLSEIKFVFSPRTTNNLADYLAKMGSMRKVMFKASW
ncbi:hypothetical protein F3Y22_tig00110596pilonHSYRG00035 [Hibiscus syriacus]|uniref:RRM domain-containing protein n=1 Tax=Hibiscus syriacus TaxID=106335 RepID=A0A6A3A468_HIBSY|nr:hypothetical protein F3Y22_tig00110596pilonHSYRG00035 [Hibiscus syriacus]